jgi:phage N-6-adenine-methyltransferase
MIVFRQGHHKESGPVGRIRETANRAAQKSGKEVLRDFAPPGERRKFSVNQGNSTGNNYWETPPELADALTAAIGGFDLDPCAATGDRRKARLKASILLTAADDGLSARWSGKVFVNPPYSRGIADWVAKCWRESQRGCVVIGLLPVRPDTAWWHDYVANKADVFMLKGRLKFSGSPTAAPFPSCVVCWNAFPGLIIRLATALDSAWHVGRGVPARRGSERSIQAI